MLTRDIIVSCSNARVAQAALASIGGPFASRVQAHAEGLGMDAGELAANTVQRFAIKAKPRDWDALLQAIAGHDQPVLAGLRHILDAGLDKGDDVVESPRRAKGKAPPGFADNRPRDAGYCQHAGC